MTVAATTKQPSFGPELFSFLADLRANNDREWFTANRHRYEEHLLAVRRLQQQARSPVAHSE